MIDYLKSDKARNDIYNYFKQKQITRLNFDISESLFTYSDLNEYTIENLIKNRITITNPKLFNDLYDSTMHRNSLPDILKRKKTTDELMIQLGINPNPRYDLEKDFAKRDRHFMRYLTEPMRIKCFTEDNKNILMWSHYANKNKGICIEYNFSSVNHKELIFPVIYLSEPIDLTELCNQDSESYNLELAVLLSLITKCRIWRYETEWRFILGFHGGKSLPDRTPIENIPLPSSITLGKSFIEYWSSESKNNINGLYNKFIEYVIKNNIPLKIIQNKILSYELEVNDIDHDEIKDPKNFFRKHYYL